MSQAQTTSRDVNAEPAGGQGTRVPHLVRHGTLYLQIVTLTVMIALWEWIADRFDTVFWTSSPSGVLRELVSWAQSGQLASDVALTLTEAGVGFVIGSVAGALLGFLLGWVRRLGDLFEPFVLSFYTLPKVALAPLFVLWFGIGALNKIMFSGLLVFFMVFFTTFQGMRQVDTDLLANARLLGASRLQTFIKIAIPYSAVWVFAGLRIGLPYALIGAIVGEFVAADSGVGYRIKEATSFFNTAAVFAGLVVLMVISLAFLAILKAIERRTLRWQTIGETDATAPGEAHE